ncbi:MAG TPA: NAD(P)-dependent oxidoreductase [Planctomycetota bacterium]|nr:NAD(P)-dependent oxidoreductase [Planctomycetota bacterium]
MTVSLKGKRIAIVGGAGFIGHNMAMSYSRQGAEVFVVDGLQVNNLLSFSSSGNEVQNRELYLRIIQQRLDLLHKAGIPVFVQDARDYQALTRLFTGPIKKPQVIIHLAAVSHAGRSNKDPWSTFDHSSRTLENALDCARGNAEHFIYFSSSMAYGNFQTEVVDEEHPLNPIGIYGALKVGGEKIVIAYKQVFDLDYTIIRPSALYGPRCVSRRVGQIFIENAISGKPLRIEGDGEEKLDFTYIEDLVDGVARVMSTPAARNQIFNLTYGGARSIKELADIVVREFPGTPVERVKRDALMPVRGTLSVEKARKLIGFEPQWPIERGMAEYIDWYRTPMDARPLPAPNAVGR